MPTSLQEDFSNATKKMQKLQTLDVLYSLPKGFEEAIKAANDGVVRSLDSELMNAGYLKAGNVYARSVPTPSGDVRMQCLPGYNYLINYRSSETAFSESIKDISCCSAKLNCSMQSHS